MQVSRNESTPGGIRVESPNHVKTDESARAVVTPVVTDLLQASSEEASLLRIWQALDPDAQADLLTVARALAGSYPKPDLPEMF